MRGLRNIVQKIPDKYLNWGAAISVVLALFASVDKGIHNKTTKYGLPTY